MKKFLRRSLASKTGGGEEKREFDMYSIPVKSRTSFEPTVYVGKNGVARFNKAFADKYCEGLDYFTVYYDDRRGYLAFKFQKEKTIFTFKLSAAKRNGTRVARILKPLRYFGLTPKLPGSFDVEFDPGSGMPYVNIG